MSRSVLCRSGASRRPPVSSGGRRSNRLSMAAGGRTLILAAASSIASGSPSSRAQISATMGAIASVSSKSGRTALARSTKRATASFVASAAAFVR